MRLKHGHARRISETPEFRSWVAMRRRCRDPRYDSYQHYGARGIKVCDRWRLSFAAFLEDMGPKPTPKHQIDRIDSAGNYEPGNCRWATCTENNRNRAGRHWIEIDGVVRCLSEWAEIANLHRNTIRDRQRTGVSGRDLLVSTDGAYHRMWQRRRGTRNGRTDAPQRKGAAA